MGALISSLTLYFSFRSEFANNLEAAKAAGCTNLGNAAEGSPAPAGGSSDAKPSASPVTGTPSASGAPATIVPFSSVVAKGPEPSSGNPASGNPSPR